MASTYLSRTPASAGNRKTFTISTWVKRSNISSQQTIISAATGSLNNVGFSSSGNFTYWEYIPNDTTEVLSFTTNALYRDVSAWYHIVLAVDTTQATSSNRVKIYVNGVQQTSFSTSNYPSQNTDLNFNNNVTHQIGRYANYAAAYFDGLMASFYMIDGQQLTPSSFGQTDTTTGIWKPKSYSGSYGTNGFFLKFESSGSLGTDSSGNGNNFTVNGTPTQTLDTPSNFFATLNPLAGFSGGTYTYSNGNTTCQSNVTRGTSSNLAIAKGKWYTEAKLISTASSTASIGVWGNMPPTNTGAYSQVDGYVYLQNGNKQNNNSASSYGTSYTNNDIIGIALDLDNNYVYFAKNGTWQNSGVPTSGASGTGAAYNVLAASSTTIGVYSFHSDEINDTAKWSWNFGNGYFETTAISSPYSDGAGLGKFQYSVPTGYYALCTKNINVYG